ncbi:MAG: hypothetical protein IJZ36_03960 [Bacilli bacterium]|nr:hypothetical protein [Bacilli bacterium]
MVKKVNSQLPRQYYIRNLCTVDSVWKYQEIIQNLGNKLGTGEVYGVMYHTEIQELDTLLLLVENEDKLIEFLEQVYQILEENYTLVDAISLEVAIKLGFQEHIDKHNRLVRKL